VRLDELRRRYRLPAAASEDEIERIATAEADPSQHSEAREQKLKIEQAFEQLSPGQRAVIELHRGQNLPFAEIGEILGINEGAARLRAFRAYERLRELIGDDRSDRSQGGPR
jgi:RNA polymerase sigma-70 factor (ECF subfamily)